MTPFIDVMLVLLIIFMVAAPLLTSGVSVDLPQTSASALNVDRKPIAVSLNEQGQLYLMDQPISNSDLVPKLQAVSQNDVDQRIYAGLQSRSFWKGGADHGGRDLGRIQKGGGGRRADQSIARSGFGRAAVILVFGGLERSARRTAGFPPVRLRLGAEIRGQPEAIPVETVSQSELNQIMNGEKDARPAPDRRLRPADPDPAGGAARSARFGGTDPDAASENRAFQARTFQARTLRPRRQNRRRPRRRNPKRRTRPSRLRGRRSSRPRPSARGAAGEAEARPDRQGRRARQDRGEADARLRSKRDRQADRTETVNAFNDRDNKRGGRDGTGPAASRRAAHVDLDGLSARRVADRALPQLLDAAADDARGRRLRRPDQGGAQRRRITVGAASTSSTRRRTRPGAHAESAMRAVKKCDPLPVPPVRTLFRPMEDRDHPLRSARNTRIGPSLPAA